MAVGGFLCGYCSVAAVNDTAWGSIHLGGRKLGLNPALPLDGCVMRGKSLSLSIPQFPPLSRAGGLLCQRRGEWV